MDPPRHPWPCQTGKVQSPQGAGEGGQEQGKGGREETDQRNRRGRGRCLRHSAIKNGTAELTPTCLDVLLEFGINCTQHPLAGTNHDFATQFLRDIGETGDERLGEISEKLPGILCMHLQVVRTMF